MKLVVLTYESHQANAIIDRILRRRPGDVVGIVCSRAILPNRGPIASVSHVLRRAGIGFVAWKAAEVACCRAAWAWADLRGRIPPTPSLAQLSRAFAVPVVDTISVDAPSLLETVRSWQPDLLVSVHFNLRIRPALLAIAPLGAINVHGSALPKNRGLFPYFWGLADGDTAAGVTVHWIDEEFDTGDVLLRATYPISAGDTVASLAWKGARLGADLVERALAQISDGIAARTPQVDDGTASYRSWPTTGDLRRFRARGSRFGSPREVWQQIFSGA